MKRPNFFIVGAPKCGTTALSEYLGDHHNIFVSRPKEPYYFADDFPAHQLVSKEANYINIFNKASQNHTIICEASAGYLYSQTALLNISKFDPKAKIVIMLRNPVDLVHSLHSQFIYDFDEDEPDFEKAWRLQSDRKFGKSIPKLCKTPDWLQYGMVGKLGCQVERALKNFPREQIKFILFDDFCANTRATYESVLDFLAVPYDGRLEFCRVNENKVRKFRSVSRVLNRPKKALSKAIFPIKSALGIERIGLTKKLWKMSAIKVSRPPLRAEFRAELNAFFEADIKKLSGLLKKPLYQWITAGGVGNSNKANGGAT